MIAYAPAWLRRWRQALVPVLAVVGVGSLVALLVLPGFEQAMAPNFAAILAGGIAWAPLMLLLNGDPLPMGVPFETVAIDADGAVEFDVRYTEEALARARSEFWLRSTRELRLGSVFVGPLAMAYFTVVGWKVASGTIVPAVFGFFLVLSIVAPVGLYFLNKRAGAEHARRFPQVRVRVAPEGIAVGEGSKALAWSNVARVWESDETLTLVLNPYMAIQLPRAQVPEAARAIILSRT
jgi:hypothetical protein